MYNCELNKTETSLFVRFWTRKKLIELMLMLSDDHLNVHWWPLSNVVCARVFVQCSNVQLVSDWSKEKHLSDFPFPPSFFSSSMIGCSDLCSDLQTFRLLSVKTVSMCACQWEAMQPIHRDTLTVMFTINHRLSANRQVTENRRVTAVPSYCSVLPVSTLCRTLTSSLQLSNGNNATAQFSWASGHKLEESKWSCTEVQESSPARHFLTKCHWCFCCAIETTSTATAKVAVAKALTCNLTGKASELSLSLSLSFINCWSINHPNWSECCCCSSSHHRFHYLHVQMPPL